MTVRAQAALVAPGEGRALPGIVFKIYARQSGGAFSIVEHPYGPRVLVPPHAHAAVDQVTYVLAGTVGIRVGDDEFLAEAGSYVVKPRGIPHAHWNPSDVAARVMEISSPGSFEGMFEGMGAILAAPGPDGPQRLRDLGLRYGTTFVMDWVPGLIERFGLKLLGT
jgi:quercetin dioxygenase-like cupin family protein